jgi:hypothetical protein
VGCSPRYVLGLVLAAFVACGPAVSSDRASDSPLAVLDVRLDPDVLAGRDILPMECEVHHQPIDFVVAPVVYGYVEFGPCDIADVGPKQFPWAGGIHFGGCIIKPARWAIVPQCAQCREREIEWERGLALTGQRFLYDAAVREGLRARAEQLQPPPRLAATAAAR